MKNKFRYLVVLAATILLSNVALRARQNNTAKSAKVFDAVVAADNSGDYTSVQKAIDAAPDNGSKPYLIFVKDGDYNEVIVVPKEKPFIYLIGQDKNKTIIHYKLNVQSQSKEDFKWNQNDWAAWKFSVHNPDAKVYKFPGEVVTINASDFYAENISFINDWGVEKQSGPQALTMSTQADRIAFNNCIFRSFQDTWMTSMKGINDRLYATNCRIEGAVDYFYGGGNAYVEKSTFYNVRSGSVIVAPSHKEGTQWGYVFDHCTIDGNAAAADGKLKMGRPWHERPIVVYLYTVMKIPVDPQGWTDMGAIPAIFADYKSVDAQGNPISTSERKTIFKDRNAQKEGSSKAVLTDEQAAKYTYHNVLSGIDNWNPRSLMKQVAKPSVTRSEKTLTWKAVTGAKGYIVLRNNSVIGFTQVTTYTDSGYINKAMYRIQGVNENGSLGNVSDICR